MKKYHIEPNTVQETLVIPLYARKLCGELYPSLFDDRESARVVEMLDYDFAARADRLKGFAGRFGALEVAQRQYDLAWEAKDYLKAHPRAAVVNLGCGLDVTFRGLDNGTCLGYEIDLPDVIAVRDALLPSGDRERSVGADLNDFRWMDEIDASGGAVFFASGVFYYFRAEQVKRLLAELAKRFPGGVIAFDACNEFGARMMRRTWLKGAGITDVNAYFSVKDVSALADWSADFASVTSRGYMTGYRKLKGINPVYRLLARVGDGLVGMRIVKIAFRG